MKKLGFAFLCVSIIFGAAFFFIYILIAAPTSSSITPIPPPCTEKKVKEYKQVADDLGVPYDIPLLADFFNTQKYSPDGFEQNIEQVPVVFSVLEFCYIDELVYHYRIIGYRRGDPIYGWVQDGHNTYSSSDAILGYIHKTRKNIDLTVSQIISLIPTAAAEKSSDTVRYVTSFGVVPESEYMAVVDRQWRNIPDDEVSTINVLHKEKYLPKLYSEYITIGPDLEDIQLPNITVGNISRTELAAVATSIIGWPYEWGGKCNSIGKPANGLDCSGYTDWVYYQCFGKGIGSGTAGQFYRCAEISESELKVGDLGFYYLPEDVGVGRPHEFNHVGIYIGEIDGLPAFIHCGGESFGTPQTPTGRVGISINSRGHKNNVNPLGGSFSPPMISTNFQYFRRPQFSFAGE